MELKEQYQYIAAEDAAISEFYDRYTRDGYTVTRDFRLGNFIVDLYAEKDDEKFAFEFKVRSSSDFSRKKLADMREYAQQQNIHFRVVYVHIPESKEIEVDGVEDTLLDYFMQSIPSDLDSLSSHTTVDEVEEATLTKVQLREKGKIYIEGNSSVIVDLYYDEDVNFSDSYPFTFKGIWKYGENGKLELEELSDLNIDTSSFDD